MSLVDHTGLDVVAYYPETRSRIGITVKSRTRDMGKEAEQVNLLSCQKGKNDRQKLLDACVAFGCEPWLAVYVETSDYADVFLTSLKHYDDTYRVTGLSLDVWKMSPKYLARYHEDTAVKHIRANFTQEHWSWTSQP